MASSVGYYGLICLLNGTIRRKGLFEGWLALTEWFIRVFALIISDAPWPTVGQSLDGSQMPKEIFENLCFFLIQSWYLLGLRLLVGS